MFSYIPSSRSLQYQFQKGFLSIVAILLVVVIGFVTVAATYLFTNESRTSADELSSAQAFYLAQAGIEAGKHTIITNNNSCTSINGGSNYTNATFTGANGVFTVTGTLNTSNSTLSSNIDNTATTIPLTSTTNFTNSGVVNIGNEFINYTGISGNNLTGVTRDVAGTSAASYSSGQNVSQAECVLNSTGYVPNSSSYSGKRTLQAILAGIKTFSIGSYNAGIYSVGPVSLTGNAMITNLSVTSSSNNFAGSTIVSSKDVTISGSASTEVSNGTGGNVTSSSSQNGLNSDVQQNVALFNTANLFNDVFGQPKAAVMANSNLSYNSNNLDGATYQSAGNKVIWINSSLSLSGNQTIGTTSSPVILVVNSDLNITGNVTINGLLYVTGNLTMSGTTIINGIVAVEGSMGTTGTGNSTINYTSTITSNLVTESSNIVSTIQYDSIPASLQELTP